MTQVYRHGITDSPLIQGMVKRIKSSIPVGVWLLDMKFTWRSTGFGVSVTVDVETNVGNIVNVTHMDFLQHGEQSEEYYAWLICEQIIACLSPVDGQLRLC